MPYSGALRVFLVEDSPATRDRLIEFIEEPGEVSVVGFADTEVDAVRQLATKQIDLAVVDLNLREGTGLGVIEAVNAMPTKPRPTLAVFTNYAFPEFQTACLDRGADHFFDKSQQINELKELTHQLASTLTEAH